MSSGATLSNVNNVISGAGFIGAVNDGLNFVNSGTVIGGIGGGTLFINTGATPVINGGTLEGVTSGQGNQGGLVFNSMLSAIRRPAPSWRRAAMRSSDCSMQSSAAAR